MKMELPLLYSKLDKYENGIATIVKQIILI